MAIPIRRRFSVALAAMYPPSRRQIGFNFAICLVFLLSSALDAVADDATNSASAGPVDIQFALGFSEVFRLGKWTPLTVTVSNRGNDLRGQLEVVTKSGDELQGNLFGSLHRRTLELPGGARKRFRFTVFLDNPLEPLIIRVRSAGRDLARRTIDLRGRFSASRLILVLSRAADLDYLNDNRGEALRVLYPHPELLPDHWQGYDGAEAVVIHGMSLEQLSARQFESLRKWLSRGGILALSGGPDYALLRSPRLAGLTPGVPIGIAPISDADLAGFPRAFDVHRLARFQGRVLYQAGEFPLIIEQNRGQGRVLYLTFDIARSPFAGWPGMKRLWLDSLRLPPPPRMALTRVEPKAASPSASPLASPMASPIPAVIRKSRQEFPEPVSVLVFLILYLGILATGYRLAAIAKTHRKVLPWLTWASPLLFAPLAYLLFGPLLFPKGAAAVILATIEPMPDSPYAQLHLDLGIYSNQKSDLRFEYEGVEPVFRSARPAPPQTENWVFHEGPRRFLQPEDQREYVLHLLTGQDIIHYDLNGSVAESKTGLQLRLRNESSRFLSNAWLIIGDRAYPLGSIPVDAEWLRDLDADTSIERYKISRSEAFSGLSQQAEKILFEHTLAALGQEPNAILLGFAPSPLRVSGATRSWLRTESALVILRLPLTRLANGLTTGMDHEPN